MSLKEINIQSPNFLSILSDKIPTQIWEMSDIANYGHVNASHAAFFGRTRATTEFKNIYELLSKEEADICVAQNKIAFETKCAVFSDEWAFDSNRERRLLHIVKTPELDESGNVFFLACTAEDITDRYIVEEQNRMKERILYAITRFSSMLFSENLLAIGQGLAILGEAVQVDRVYYWENHFDHVNDCWLTSQKFEWVSKGIDAQIDNADLQNLPIETFSDFMGPLREHKPFIAHIKDIKQVATREVLSAQQIKSILVLPVYIAGEFTGFVGFDSCISEREWMSEEVALLETFVELLAKSLFNKQLISETLRSKQNFDNFFNMTDDMHFILDFDGNMLHFNKTVLQKTGYTEFELIGNSILMLHPYERRAEALETVIGMVNGSCEACQIPLRTKHGLQFPVVTHVCKGEWNGKPALFGVTQDMTKQQFSEEKFSKAFEGSSLMMAIVDTTSGKHIEVNEEYCRVLGYERHELIGKTPSELSLPASPEFTAQAEKTIFENLSVVRREVECNDRNGHVHTVILNVNPITIGKLSCEVVSMLDITERKRIELELLSKSVQTELLLKDISQSRLNFTNFFNTINDLLFILDTKGNMFHVNETVLQKTGYTEDELIGQSVLMLHPANRQTEALEIVIGMVNGTCEACLIPLVTKAGLQFPVVTHVCKGVWNGEPALFGVTQDMAEQQFSEEKFSKAFDNSVQMMAILDTSSGKHISVNDSFCRTLGYSRDEIVGKTPSDLSLFPLPEDNLLFYEARINRVAILDAEITMLDKNHIHHIVSISAVPINIGMLTCILVNMLDITDRKNMERELQIYNNHLQELVEEKVQTISDTIWGTINALVCLAESRDDATGGHLRRLEETCRVISTALSFNSIYSEQLTNEYIVNLQQASLLHDIGKVSIPDSILLKKGKLTTEEFEEMKKHTLAGAQTLEQAYQHTRKSDLIQMGIDIALSHHERWDGAGYPNGLKETEIPLAAQIVSICDVYDALRSTRCYKAASTHEESLAEIRRDIGHRFNPVVARAFIHYERDIEQIYRKYTL